MESLIVHYGYIAILIGTLLEGETILVLGGFAAHRGLLWLPGVMAAALVGSMFSDQLFFFLGRRRGWTWLANKPRWQPRAERVRRLLDRHSTALILTFRFLYGLRNITPFVLGMSSVSTPRFLALNAIGAALWSVAISLLGWSVGEAAERMIGHIKRYERSIGAAILAVGAVLWLLHHLAVRRRARAARTGAPAAPESGA
jgi:membrane protein DedA with SNARE-associated domain